MPRKKGSIKLLKMFEPLQMRFLRCPCSGGTPVNARFTRVSGRFCLHWSLWPSPKITIPNGFKPSIASWQEWMLDGDVARSYTINVCQIQMSTVSFCKILVYVLSWLELKNLSCKKSKRGTKFNFLFLT